MTSPIDFLLRPAETKLRGLIAITNIDCVKDKAVYYRLSGVSRSISDRRY
jgi:hypothetical protein